MSGENTTYNYIIAGGGCAGLSLAYMLTQSKLHQKRILIIDKDDKNENDRTWCFWSSNNASTVFSSVISKSWNNAQFADHKGLIDLPLQNLNYHLIKGIDFYRFIKKTLHSHPNVTFLKGFIKGMETHKDRASVSVGHHVYDADYVFSSLQNASSKSGHYHHLLQHFKGWVIKTQKPVFNPAKFKLMDFRTPQYGNARFFYVLPFAKNQALVEYTIFSEHLSPKHVYDQMLQKYIKEVLAIDAYTVEEEEKGIIPMTDQPMIQEKSRIIAIGTAAGAVKPTTGYAFQRIMAHNELIIEQLVSGGHDWQRPPSAGRFLFYDRLLLNILRDAGEESVQVFSQLFRRNRINHILKFLDERSTVVQEGKIFSTLPLWPFIKAIYRTQLQIRNNDITVPASL